MVLVFLFTAIVVKSNVSCSLNLLVQGIKIVFLDFSCFEYNLGNSGKHFYLAITIIFQCAEHAISSGLIVKKS